MDFTPRQHRIRRGALALATLALIIALAILVSAAVYARHFAEQRLERSASERVDQAASLAAISIAENVQRLTATTTMLSGDDELRTALRTNDAAVRDRLARRLLESTPGARSSYIVSPDGTLLSIYPLDRSFLGRRFTDRDWYQGVQHTSPYISNAFRTPAPGHPHVVAIASTVRDGAKVLGIVGVSVETAQFGSALQRATRVDGSPDLLLRDRLHETIAGALPGAATDSLRAARDVRGTGWRLIASLPKQTAFGDLRRIRAGITTFAALVSLLLLVLGGVLFAMTRTLYGQQLRDERREQAFELNDTIVQRLAVAHLALSVGRPEEALQSLDEALDAGRRMIGQLAEGRQSYVRNAPAHAGEEVPT
jgi:C4-dicarboxylate-specific signal transduction histidine kinase